MRCSRLLCLLGGVCTLTACSPVSVTFTFGLDRAELTETVVDDQDADGAKIALIDVTGVITEGPTPALIGSSPSPLDELSARLEKAAEDNDVKAVVLRVNSPGGSVVASKAMYDETRRFAEETGRPVVVSLGEVAASGGYYLALAGDEILAAPGSITGSIGVIIPLIKVHDGLSRIGVYSATVKSGDSKDMGSPLAEDTPAERAIFESLVADMYADFRGSVVARRAALRDAPTDRVDTLTDGRVFTGSQALEAGLVDRVGGLRDAIARAGQLAGVSRYNVVKYHPKGAPVRTAYSPQGSLVAPAPQSEGPATVLPTAASLRDGLLSGLSPGTPYYIWAPGL